MGQECVILEAMNSAIDDAIAIWKAGVAAVDPRKAVVETLRSIHELIEIDDRILVVGGGKAGAAMAAGVEDALASRLEHIEGLVNVPAGTEVRLKRLILNPARAATSNFPTEAGAMGSRKMLEYLRNAGPDDFGLCLISGGGSALLPAPAKGISLDDKQRVTRLLHATGATIQEMNCVRKHLSEIKGGRLAATFAGKKLWSLIVSDVVGNPLDVIASGPTAADPTTYFDALMVLEKYHLTDEAPQSVIKHLEAGVAGSIPETPKEIAESVQNIIIADNDQAKIQAHIQAGGLKYDSEILAQPVVGEAHEAARVLAREIRNRRKKSEQANYSKGNLTRRALIFGGETTVTLGHNPGKGGRSQELVLAMLCELGVTGMSGVTILCAGTDGEDGPTDAAGAIGTQESLIRAHSLNLNPRDFLKRHDSYHFFQATGELFKTGLTGTNVMDLGVILLN